MKIRCVSVAHVINKYGRFVWNVEFATGYDNFPMGQATITYEEEPSYIVGKWYSLVFSPEMKYVVTEGSDG